MDQNLKTIKLNKGLFYNSISSILLILSKLIRGLLIPKLLDPFSYGLFNSVALFLRYLQFSDIGRIAFFLKRAPSLNFNEKKERLSSFLDTTFSFILFSAFIVSVILLFIHFIIEENNHFFKQAILVLAPFVFFLKLNEFILGYLMSIADYKKFVIYKNIYLYSSMIIVVYGVYIYGALGGVIGMLISEIFFFLLLNKSAKIKFKFNLNFKIFSDLRDSLKQFTVQLIEVISLTIDQAFFLFILGPMKFGIFILALTFSWIYESISEVFVNTFHPKLFALYDDKREAIKLLQKVIFLYISVCFLAIPALIFCIELVINFFLTDYADVLTIHSLVLFIGFYRGLLSILKRGYIVLDLERRYVSNCIIAILVNLIGLSSAFFFELSLDEVVFLLVSINLLVCCVFYLSIFKVNNILNFMLLISIFLFFLVTVLYFLYQNLIINLFPLFSLFIFFTIFYLFLLLIFFLYRPNLERFIME